MRKKICAVGTVCALIFTACGKAGSAVATSGEGASQAAGQPSGRLQVESVDSQVITVTSKETVKVVPDQAEIIFAVTTQHKDAVQCQNENKEKLNQLIESLKALGIAETSIQTSGFDLNPRYDWEKNGEIIGYEATTQVTVADVKIDEAGTIMEKSVESGMNRIQSVSFLSSNYDESYQEALKLAVDQAQEKAQALADASGCTLGRPVHITEYTPDDSYRYNSQKMMSRSAGAGAEASMADMGAVMPGEIQVEASISVDYAIQ
ncbi:MAG: SIMPL domain-containing protein [Lachnospiraceae bacterium]|jgi:uncharacterized protein YggE|nr:SIMPL domain-containing protein [Lachnospiraceae bacterium]